MATKIMTIRTIFRKRSVFVFGVVGRCVWVMVFPRIVDAKIISNLTTAEATRAETYLLVVLAARKAHRIATRSTPS